MEKLSSIQKSNNDYGIQSRIGIKFHEEIIKMRAEWNVKNPGKNISHEKITNLILRHKNWNKNKINIRNDIITLKEEEVEQFGYG